MSRALRFESYLSVHFGQCPLTAAMPCAFGMQCCLVAGIRPVGASGLHVLVLLRRLQEWFEHVSAVPPVVKTVYSITGMHRRGVTPQNSRS